MTFPYSHASKLSIDAKRRKAHDQLVAEAQELKMGY
jgi:hypothetical protein